MDAYLSLVKLEFWHWWAIALIFVVVEALSPSGAMAALAVAAAIVGAIFMLEPEMEAMTQLGIFFGLSVVLFLMFHFFLKDLVAQSKKDKASAQALIGKQYTLTSSVRNGFGELVIDGERWSLKGPDIDKGTEVRIIGLDSKMLVVAPVGKTYKSGGVS